MSKPTALVVSTATAFCLILLGCGGDPAPAPVQVKAPKEDGHNEHEHGNHDGKHEGHHHEAPHGGALVVFGEEFAHMEMVVDEAAGKLTCYFLDGLATNGVRLKAQNFTLQLSAGEKKETVALKGVANDLTGETINDSSQFEGQSDFLKATHEFEVHISALNIKGVEFKDVKFDFPKGNEAHDDDGHDEEHGEHKKNK